MGLLVLWGNGWQRHALWSGSHLLCAQYPRRSPAAAGVGLSARFMSLSSSGGCEGGSVGTLVESHRLLVGNKLLTVQTLKDRLASHLENMGTLEVANSHPEVKICGWYQK